ncbi:hypothetical protein CLHUN_05330 [Ruminiclostridium hungatei]|uniref:Uncharacterized protein n=1 Tax=Ruminiclostridium hungatei TaxID=48256 RepID=A0A1V4SQ52_RUMHU|nr:hypothetical protein CLHUN_05330 [Ruminiclostridium hungatei]
MLETYIRETTELVHLTINGGLIKTTFEHPFYVKDAGFVKAGELEAGNEVLASSGNVLVVENRKIEITDEPTKVYNFQVDDFHTYHVGDNGVLVHNANYSEGTGSTLKNLKGLDDFLNNPSKLKNVTPNELYNHLKNNGYNPQPLSGGSYKGVTFENGGGFKVNWGGDRILQYHPAGKGHHGGFEYWKISSGPTGTIRYDMNGNTIK